jgi:hypothetical protein
MYLSFNQKLVLVAHSQQIDVLQKKSAERCSVLISETSSNTAKINEHLIRLSRICAPLCTIQLSQIVYIVSQHLVHPDTLLTHIIWLFFGPVTNPVAQNSSRRYLLQSGALLCCFCWPISHFGSVINIIVSYVYVSIIRPCW